MDIAVPCILCLDNGEISHKLPLGIIELKEAIKVLKDDNVEPFKEKPIDIEKVVHVNQSTKKGRSKVNIIQKNDSMGAYKKKPEHNKKVHVTFWLSVSFQIIIVIDIGIFFCWGKKLQAGYRSI